MLLAYLGPETTLPLASVVATSLGFLLMFGRQVVRVLGAAVQPIRKALTPSRSHTSTAVPAPHLFQNRPGRPARVAAGGAASRTAD